MVRCIDKKQFRAALNCSVSKAKQTAQQFRSVNARIQFEWFKSSKTTITIRYLCWYKFWYKLQFTEIATQPHYTINRETLPKL